MNRYLFSGNQEMNSGFNFGLREEQLVLNNQILGERIAQAEQGGDEDSSSEYDDQVNEENNSSVSKNEGKAAQSEESV